MIIMFLTIVMDLLSSCLTLSDFGQKTYNNFPNSVCEILAEEEWGDNKRTLVILSLFFVFSRGVLVLLFNVGLFINVAMIYLKLGKSQKVAPVVSESKTNQEDLWISYPGPKEEDPTQSEDRPDVRHAKHEHATHNQQPQEQRGDGHHYQVPFTGARHHPEPDPDHRGYRDVYHHQTDNRSEEPNNNRNRTARRAPSFADRLREADTNFSNNKVFLSICKGPKY